MRAPTTTKANETAALASAEPLSIGDLHIIPARLIAVSGGKSVRLEPRVMLVLLALVESQGVVVTRDALIGQCWSQRIVTDDAIQRCIASLRKLASTFDPPPFAIETIVKVGYRLVARDTAMPSQSPDMSREPDPASAIPRAGQPSPAMQAAYWPRAAYAVPGVLFLLLVAAMALFWPQVAAPRYATILIQPFEEQQGEREGGGLAPILARELAAGLHAARVPAEIRVITGTESPDRSHPGALWLAGTVSEDSAGLQIQLRFEASEPGKILWTSAIRREALEVSEVVSALTSEVSFALLGPSGLLRYPPDSFPAVQTRLQLADLERKQRWAELLAAADDAAGNYPDDARILALFARSVHLALESVPLEAREGLVARARRAGERALVIDPEEGAAYVALSKLMPAANRKERMRLLSAGLEHAPANAELMLAMGTLHVEMGQLAEGIRWRELSLARDPYAPDLIVQLALDYASTGYRAKAYEALDRVASDWAGGHSRVASGPWAGAVLLDASLIEATLAQPDFQQRPRARQRLEAMAAAIREPTPERLLALRAQCGPDIAAVQYATACAYALANLGDTDGALETLEAFLLRYEPVAHNPGDRLEQYLRSPVTGGLANVLNRPVFRELWSTERMWVLFDHVGLVDFWSAEGLWPDFCAGHGGTVDCGALRSAVADRRALARMEP